MMKTGILTVLTGAFVLTAAGATAQNATPVVAPGTPVTATLTSSDALLSDGRNYRCYRLRTTAGQSYAIELNSNEAIKQGVLCGLGIAMLSLHAAHDELVAGRLVPLRGPGLPMMRQWYVAVPTAMPVPATVTRIADAVAALNGTFLPG